MNEYHVRCPGGEQEWTIFARSPEAAAEQWGGELESEYQGDMWDDDGLKCVVIDKSGREFRYSLHASVSISAEEVGDGGEGGGA